MEFSDMANGTTEPFDAVLADMLGESTLFLHEITDYHTRLAAAHAAEVAERDARIAELEADKNAMFIRAREWATRSGEQEQRAEAAERDAGYLRWRLEEILPLFEEARDALPAITETARKLRNIRPDLADRMDAAGTRTREQYAAIATTEQADED